MLIIFLISSYPIRSTINRLTRHKMTQTTIIDYIEKEDRRCNIARKASIVWFFTIFSRKERQQYGIMGHNALQFCFGFFVLLWLRCESCCGDMLLKHEQKERRRVHFYFVLLFFKGCCGEFNTKIERDKTELKNKIIAKSYKKRKCFYISGRFLI